MIDKTKVKNILFITLSNIGDVVLTLPVLGALKRAFPDAKISVMVSPYVKEIFSNDQAISKIISYDKHISFLDKIKLGLRLRRKNFDLVVDLRATIYPIIINPLYKTSLLQRKGPKTEHKKQTHLNKIAKLGIDIENASYNLHFNEKDRFKTEDIFKGLNISDADKVVAVAPGAKSHIKRWTINGFAGVCRRLNRELGVKVLLVGDNKDKQIISQILATGLNDAYDVSGQTDIIQLAYLLSQCKLLITNDSAPLHLADLVDTPAVAIFGPTNHMQYGPTLAESVVIRKGLKCSPCEKALCAFSLECMKQISAEEVFIPAKKILSSS